jgi:hypothetical protein
MGPVGPVGREKSPQGSESKGSVNTKVRLGNRVVVHEGKDSSASSAKVAMAFKAAAPSAKAGFDAAKDHLVKETKELLDTLLSPQTPNEARASIKKASGILAAAAEFRKDKQVVEEKKGESSWKVVNFARGLVSKARSKVTATETRRQKINRYAGEIETAVAEKFKKCRSGIAEQIRLKETYRNDLSEEEAEQIKNRLKEEFIILSAFPQEMIAGDFLLGEWLDLSKKHFGLENPCK